MMLYVMLHLGLGFLTLKNFVRLRNFVEKASRSLPVAVSKTLNFCYFVPVCMCLFDLPCSVHG